MTMGLGGTALPPAPELTGTVYGVALNYKDAYDALAEAMRHPPYGSPPVAPVLYLKPANTINGHGGAIELPPGIEALEMNAALGIVFARAAKKVRPEEALDYVAGYAAVNDVTIPHAQVYRPAIKEKCRDGFCPVSAAIARKEDVADPDHLEIRVLINGELRQTTHTGNLVRNVRQLIADVSQFMTLREGDMLLAGIPHNPPLARANDVVRIEIESVGALENIVTTGKGA